MSLRGKKIFVDPGHGGTASEGRNRCGTYAVGTSGKKSGNEKSSALAIAEVLVEYLEEAGANVKMSRTTDDPVCLDERAKMANKWGADIFVSLHHNSSTNTSANGLSAHYYKSEDKALAEAILPRIVDYTGLDTWGSTGIRKDNFQVLRDTDMPATLLELGFMSNPDDDAFIADYDNKIDMAGGIYRGIRDYFE